MTRIRRRQSRAMMGKPMPDRRTKLVVHRRGFWFRIRGYGFLAIVTRHPLYALRKHGWRVGPVCWRVLTPPAHIDGCDV
jgi:hypothetical protein